VVKGILGQRYYESDYWPDLVPIYWLDKRPWQYWLRSELSIGRCTAVRIYWLF
jgi:hypothetical protein